MGSYEEFVAKQNEIYEKNFHQRQELVRDWTERFGLSRIKSIDLTYSEISLHSLEFRTLAHDHKYLPVWQNMLEWGVDGLCTDQSKELITFLQQKVPA